MNKSEHPYTKYHLSFKKKFKQLRNDERNNNRYDLSKIASKQNIFEKREIKNIDDMDNLVDDIIDKKLDYTVSKIDGCDLTKIKEDSSSFAIGNKDGEPLTEFDFIYISKEAIGDKNKKVEVITKNGDLRYFNVGREEIEECIGVGNLGAVGSNSISNDSSSIDSNAISYKDLKDELLTPIKGRTPLLYGGAKGGNNIKFGKNKKRKQKKFVSRI